MTAKITSQGQPIQSEPILAISVCVGLKLFSPHLTLEWISQSEPSLA